MTDQHFSSQEKAARLSGPACIWHCSTQALQAVNFGPMTSVQLPPLVSQRRILPAPVADPVFHGAHLRGICAAGEIEAVTGGEPAGGQGRAFQAGWWSVAVVGTGVGVTFPPEVSVQPAATSAATSTTMHMPEMRGWFFMEDHVCCDIRRGVYLWVYFTAKILGVMVLYQESRPVIPPYWWMFHGTGIFSWGLPDQG